jgi:phosphatidylinositol kinase/protein kinase (PI-3  family)
VTRSNSNADEYNRFVGFGDSAENTPAVTERFFRLKDYFEGKFGPSYSPRFAKAVENFVKSLAGYSLATFVLQVLV